MKRNKTKLICILAAALVFTGCRVNYDEGYSRSNSRYNYSYAYGDGQPGYDYYYNYDQQSSYNDVRYQQSNGQPPMGFNDFYHQLSPHGTWVSMSPYGQVWIANIPNFQPYSTNGYWTYTTYGWTWVSSYSWGWAPFHYGRWGYNNRYGWYWVPGYEWGPAWVAWSSSSDMYGWAPLMPGMHFNVSLSLSSFPSSYWTFMHGRYMGVNNISNYYVNRSNNVTIIKNTTIINNYGTENNRRYSMGPSANDVQRYTGRSIQPMRVTSVSDNNRSGVSSDELRVYRPVTRSDNSSSNGRTSTNSSDNNRNGSSETRSSQSTQSQQGSSQTRNSQSTQSQQGSSQTRNSQSTQQQNNPSETRNSQSTQSQQDSSQRRGSQSTQSQQGSTQTRNSQSTQQQGSSQTRSSQSTQQQSTYRPNPAQPKVSNSAAPQTSRQIQAAKNDNQKEEQKRSSTTTTTSRSNTDSQSRSSSQPRR